MVVTQNSPQPSVKDDAEIVTALRAGDQDVFRDVVADFNPGLVRLARSYVSAELADEVVQETWVAVLRSIDSFVQTYTFEHSSAECADLCNAFIDALHAAEQPILFFRLRDMHKLNAKR